MEALLKIQNELKAPKGQYNSFGKYNYRSCEDILEALKPLLLKYNATMYITDDVVSVGNRIYVKATATISDGKETISVSAFAREPESRKGMDEAQVTGATSSYARKYCLNGLFNIDDTKDSDTEEYRRINVSDTKQSAPTQKPNPNAVKIEFTDAQKAEMKKWTDGTFNADELAQFKANCLTDAKKAYENMKMEYETRHIPKEVF